MIVYDSARTLGGKLQGLGIIYYPKFTIRNLVCQVPLTQTVNIRIMDYSNSSTKSPSVLDKYSDQIQKANGAFTYNRNMFKVWNSTMISFLAMIVDKADFYKLLVEISFIVTEFVTCKKCDGKMVTRLHKNKPDGMYWTYNNKIGTGIHATKCNSSRSVRVNSWFYKSNLSMCLSAAWVCWIGQGRD